MHTAKALRQVNLNTTIVKNSRFRSLRLTNKNKSSRKSKNNSPASTKPSPTSSASRPTSSATKPPSSKPPSKANSPKSGAKLHPDVEPASELLKRILAERRAKWKGKGKYNEPVFPDMAKLPNLPKGWSWISAAQLSSAEAYSFAIGPFGSNLKVSDYTTSGGVPLIFVRNIRSSLFGTGETVFVANEKAEQLRAHHVRVGTFLLPKWETRRVTRASIRETATDAIITADCIKLRPSPLIQEKRFIVHAINSYVVKSQILGITKGVAQLKVSLARFREYLEFASATARARGNCGRLSGGSP